MKLLYLLACAFGFTRYIAYTDGYFFRRDIELVSKAGGQRSSCGSERMSLCTNKVLKVPKAFPSEELHMIVYYNLVITFLLAIGVLYLVFLADRAKAIYTGELENRYLSRLVRSPLFGVRYSGSNLFGRLLALAAIHHLVVLVYLSVRSSSRDERLTDRQVNSEYLVVCGLSALFTVMVL